jgi:hypothetical protein
MLEVMLALCLLSTVSLGSLAVLPAMFSAQHRVERQELATAAAYQVLEETCSQDFGALNSSTGQVAMGVESFQYHVQVTSPSAAVKDVTVSVSTGVRPIVLETLVTGTAGQKGQN